MNEWQREAIQSWAQENFTQVGVLGGWRLEVGSSPNTPPLQTTLGLN